MSDIDAPKTNVDDATPAAAEPPAADDPTEAAAPVSDTVDDLLRDIGATRGGAASLEVASDPAVNDWFSAAVDQLASGSLPEIPAAPVPTERDAIEPAAVIVEQGATALPDEPQVRSVDAVERDAADKSATPTTPDADARAVIPGRTAAATEMLESTQAELAPDAGTPAETVQAEPAPVERASVESPPVESGPVEPGPVESGAVEPGAVEPGAVEPSRVEPGPAAPAEVPVESSLGESVGAAPSTLDDDQMRDVDGALAADVGELLKGNFDTVSAVLDDVFDDDTASTAVEDVASSPAPPPVEDDVPATSATPAAAVAAAPLDVVDVPAFAELLPPKVREPASELLPMRPRAQATESEVRAPTPPEPAVDAGSKKEPAPTTSPEPPPPSTASPDTRWFQPMLIALLVLLSYPMRFVPPRFRPVVDWVALSLVFWVPIVWVIALFMVGSG